jgi:hypothetical protein
LTNFGDRKKIGVLLFNTFKGFKRKMQGRRGLSALNPSVEGAKGGRYGKADPLGNVFNNRKDEGQERGKANPAGFL